MTRKPEPTLASVLRDLARVAEQDGKRLRVTVLDGKREVVRVEMPFCAAPKETPPANAAGLECSVSTL